MSRLYTHPGPPWLMRLLWGGMLAAFVVFWICALVMIWSLAG